ncbi:MAG: hypothetical protein Q7R41_10050 [Phycisphaerales bacterium]|nr:hypothetical protein [Phycisphaerales bacterium]
MPTAQIVFHKLLQDSQDYHSFQKGDDHMVSRITFTLSVGGREFRELQVEVSQPFGTDADSEEFEVGKPTGPYKGPWNHNAFSDLCEKYYRSLVGSRGTAIRISGGSNIRMRNNTCVQEMRAEFEIPNEGADSW